MARSAPEDPLRDRAAAVDGEGRPRFRVFSTPVELAEAAADEVCARIDEAVRRRGRASLVLSGGSTPAALYDRVAARRPRWSAVEVFFGDERCVPPDDEGSNYRLANERLLGPLGIAPARVHRIRGELRPREAARAYEAELEAELARGPFDLVLLGIGTDGHTASLFPGSPALRVQDRLAVAVDGGPPPWRERVTLTLPALGRSRRALFLASGASKAPAVAHALAPPRRDPVPAARIRPRGCVLWLLDRPASADLPAS